MTRNLFNTSQIIVLTAIFALSALSSTPANAQMVANSGERAVTEHFNSNSSIFLVSDEDAFAEAQQLDALHGVDTQQLPGLGWSGGPMHRGHFSPGSCAEVGYNLEDRPPTLLDLNAKIDAAWTDPNSSAASSRSLVYKWLIKNRIITVKIYTISYPNIGDPGLGQHYHRAQLTYYCPILFRNSHAGLKIPIGKRSFTRWTYKNQYETPIPGKGNVKVFAGILNYMVIPNRPWFLSPTFRFADKGGSVTVKAYLDPDNGRWVISSWQMADPGLDLNNPEWKKISAESSVAPTVSRSDEVGDLTKLSVPTKVRTNPSVPSTVDSVAAPWGDNSTYADTAKWLNERVTTFGFGTHSNGSTFRVSEFSVKDCVVSWRYAFKTQRGSGNVAITVPFDKVGSVSALPDFGVRIATNGRFVHISGDHEANDFYVALDVNSQEAIDQTTSALQRLAEECRSK